MKKIVLPFILILCIACQKDKPKQSSIKHIIAPESSVVVKFNAFSDWQKSLASQSFLSKHKDNLVLKYWSLEDFKKLIDIPDEAVLSLSTLGKSKHIKTLSFDITKEPQFKSESKQSYIYDEVNIETFDAGDIEIFYSNLKGKAVLCTSKIILENIVRNYQNDIKNPAVIEKLFNVLSDKSPSLVINNELFSKLSFQFFDKNILKHQMKLSDFSGFDLNLDEDKILMSGIVFHPKLKEKFWTNFKNVDAQKSTSVEVIPSNFLSATSVLFSDFGKLAHTTESLEQKPQIDSLYLNLREITSIKLPNRNAMVLVSNNIDQSYRHLKKLSKPQKSIGDDVIYKLNQPLVPGKILSTVLDLIKVGYFSVHMDHIVLSDELETLENLIIQINNNNVVSNQANYNNHLESLNEECHVQWLTNLGNQNEFFESHSNEPFKSGFKTFTWDNHELLMSQLIVEDDFGYLNSLQKKTIENQNNTDIQQLARLKSDNRIINTPAFFENWRTGQQDVVYQDDKNVLYLKDTKGNLIWSKPLDNPIIGKISSIDIYQNRRIQMVFATKNNIHIIDKNGNDVKPFPLKFRKDITQGLSVFDYDNNGKYRFAAVFDDDIKMYDKTGKRVRGFRFKKTKTPINYPAKHIRMGNKDYILAQEESGKLHILNRRGRTRIDLDDNLRFSDNEWFEHDGYFTSLNEDGDILQIDQNAGLNRQQQKLINPKFSANEKHLVISSENKFYFNSFETELPYGLYTRPIIHKNYAGLADKQAQKIYIFNKNAEIVEGFPVFGEELIDFYSSENKIILLCKDGNNALIIYRAKFR